MADNPPSPRQVKVPRGHNLLAVLGAAVAAVVVIGGTTAVVAANRADDAPGAPGSAEPKGSASPGPDSAAPEDEEANEEATEPAESEGVEPFRGTWTGTVRFEAERYASTISIDCDSVCTVTEAPILNSSVRARGNPATGLEFERPPKGTPCDENWTYALRMSFTFDGDRLRGSYFAPAVPRGGGTMDCGNGVSSWTGLPKGTTFTGWLSKGRAPSL